MRTTEYLIEKYLDSSITSDEKAILNERLLSKTSLAKEFSFRRELNSLAYEDEISKLRVKLNMALANSEQMHSDRFIGPKVKRILYAAAAVSGIAIGGWALFSDILTNRKPESLFSEYFSPYPPVVIYRDASAADVYRKFQIAMQLYQRGSYADAALELERIYKQVPDSVTVKFYLGVTYMQLEQYSKSRDLFNQVIGSDVLFSELAIWYKGLSYLAESNADKALETFRLIEKNNSQYGNKVSRLIELLGGN